MVNEESNIDDLLIIAWVADILWEKDRGQNGPLTITEKKIFNLTTEHLTVRAEALRDAIRIQKWLQQQRKNTHNRGKQDGGDEH